MHRAASQYMPCRARKHPASSNMSPMRLSMCAPGFQNFSREIFSKKGLLVSKLIPEKKCTSLAPPLLEASRGVCGGPFWGPYPGPSAGPLTGPPGTRSAGPSTGACQPDAALDALADDVLRVLLAVLAPCVVGLVCLGCWCVLPDASGLTVLCILPSLLSRSAHCAPLLVAKQFLF